MECQHCEREAILTYFAKEQKSEVDPTTKHRIYSAKLFGICENCLDKKSPLEKRAINSISFVKEHEAIVRKKADYIQGYIDKNTRDAVTIAKFRGTPECKYNIDCYMSGSPDCNNKCCNFDKKDNT